MPKTNLYSNTSTFAAEAIDWITFPFI